MGLKNIMKKAAITVKNKANEKIFYRTSSKIIVMIKEVNSLKSQEFFQPSTLKKIFGKNGILDLLLSVCNKKEDCYLSVSPLKDEYKKFKWDILTTRAKQQAQDVPQDKEKIEEILNKIKRFTDTIKKVKETVEELNIKSTEGKTFLEKCSEYLHESENVTNAAKVALKALGSGIFINSIGLAASIVLAPVPVLNMIALCGSATGLALTPVIALATGLYSYFYDMFDNAISSKLSLEDKKKLRELKKSLEKLEPELKQTKKNIQNIIGKWNKRSLNYTDEFKKLKDFCYVCGVAAGKITVSSTNNLKLKAQAEFRNILMKMPNQIPNIDITLKALEKAA